MNCTILRHYSCYAFVLRYNDVCTRNLIERTGGLPKNLIAVG